MKNVLVQTNLLAYVCRCYIHRWIDRGLKKVHSINYTLIKALSHHLLVLAFCYTVPLLKHPSPSCSLSLSHACSMMNLQVMNVSNLESADTSYQQGSLFCLLPSSLHPSLIPSPAGANEQETDEDVWQHSESGLSLTRSHSIMKSSIDYERACAVPSLGCRNRIMRGSFLIHPRTAGSVWVSVDVCVCLRNALFLWAPT